VTQSCYTGPAGTSGVGVCASGTQTCSAGTFGSCVGQTTPGVETCNNLDDDCDGMKDEGLTQACYTGAAGTQGVGLCHAGTQTCTAGVFGGTCTGQVTPATEACNNMDDDCDGLVDETLTQACYTGPAGTQNVGTCVGGTQTCTAGSFGTSCPGEVTPATERCGDGLNTDCDANVSDASEGCLSAGTELRLDNLGGGGTGADAPGASHSFDVAIAYGGSPVGRNIYVAWSDLRDGKSEIIFRASTDGGATFGAAIKLTDGTTACVVPRLAASGDNVYVVYEDFNGGSVRNLRLRRSTNAGSSFSAAQNIVTANDNFNTDVAANGTNFVVAWEQLDTATLARNVLSRASSNSGQTLQAARTINVGSTGTHNAGRPSVAISSDNRFEFLWREKRAGATFDVFTAFSDSTSNAIAAAAEKRLDNDTAQNRDGNFPQLIAVQGNVYATWQDVSTVSGGGSDIMFARSIDGGLSTTASPTWSSEAILDDPSGEVSSSFAPTIDVDPATVGTNSDDRVFVAWQDGREGSQVYLALSVNSGTSFSAAVRASNTNGAAVSGAVSAPQLVYAGSNVVVITYQKVVSSVAHVFVASSIDAAVTWLWTDQQLDTGAGPATNPVIAPFSSASAPTLGGVVAWDDFRTAPGINGDPMRVRWGK
jgi:hypothetical protein